MVLVWSSILWRSESSYMLSLVFETLHSFFLTVEEPNLLKIEVLQSYAHLSSYIHMYTTGSLYLGSDFSET